jgi:hypothetical protein
MLGPHVVSAAARWRGRSRLKKILIVALVVTGAALTPAAGSFVPREGGNVLFGGVAEAACKWDGKPGPGGLRNVYDEWLFEAVVISNWCYNGSSVTSRHSVPYGGVTNLGVLAGWVLVRAHWAYSACHTYNGIPNHNCLTQREFWLINLHGEELKICIGTRIYGGGGHHRNIYSSSCSRG